MLLFLDLSKAFHCVETETLLVKLSKYGFRGKFLNWIESFLKNRRQYVEIKNEQKCVLSEKITVLNGVPQGSVVCWVHCCSVSM